VLFISIALVSIHIKNTYDHDVNDCYALGWVFFLCVLL